MNNVEAFIKANESGPNGPWFTVAYICNALGFDRREVRRQASEAGLAESNSGLALPESISLYERDAVDRRMTSKALSLLSRRKRFRNRCRSVVQLEMRLEERTAGEAFQKEIVA